MLSRRTVAMLSQVVLGGVLAGCHQEPPPPPPAPPPPMSSAQISRMQQDYIKADPNMRLGRVEGVRAQDSLAAVSGIAFGDVRLKDAVTFADSSNKVIANGLIITMDKENASLLVVKYEIAPGGRAPELGDVVYRVMAGK